MTYTQTFILASRNRGKLRELQQILQSEGIRVVLQSDLGLDVDTEETGTTFAENAALKALAVCRASGLPALADDSGLMVDALGGEPGVYSARFGGELCRTDADRNNLLLQRLAGVPLSRRTARFVCAIACCRPDGSRLTAQGTCEGLILLQPRGEGGFGYDPLFYLPDEGMTFAELPESRKNLLSHRAMALDALVRQLKSEGENYAHK